MAKTYPRTKTDRDIRTYIVNSYIDPQDGQPVKEDHTAYQIDCTSAVSLGLSPRGWREILKGTGSATSSLSGTRRTCSPGSSSWFTKWEGPPYYKGITYGDGPTSVSYLFGVSSPSALPGSSADAAARSKLLKDYLNARKSWRGGNFLAEFTETVHMLKHPVGSLYNNTLRFADQVRKIRNLWRYSREQYARRLGQAWLGYSFGWKPLFEDIKDANSAIEKLARGTGHDKQAISGYGKAESFLVTPNQNCKPPRCDGVPNQLDVYNTARQEVRYHGAIVSRPESFATVADTFGVSYGDILPAVWEAVPWSFLIDYFANVGEVIDSWQYAGASLAWLEQGVRNTNFRQTTANRKILPETYPGIVQSLGVGPSKGSAVFVGRGVSAIPYPSFRFKIPGLGSTKWVNMSALIAAIQRSKP